MKFGARLAEQAYPAWRDGYFRYDEMKRVVEEPAGPGFAEAGTPGRAAISSEPGGATAGTPSASEEKRAEGSPRPPLSRSGTRKFGDALREEVRRVEEFARALKTDLAERADKLESDWKTIESWKASRFPDVDAHVERAKQELALLSKEVGELLKFVSLNVTGIRKLVKKHDRRTGENAGPMLLAKLQKDAEFAFLERLSNTEELDKLVQRVVKMQERAEAVDRLTEEQSRERLRLAAAAAAPAGGGGGGTGTGSGSGRGIPTASAPSHFPASRSLASAASRPSSPGLNGAGKRHSAGSDTDSSETMLLGRVVEEARRYLDDSDWANMIGRALLLPRPSLVPTYAALENAPALATCGGFVAGAGSAALLAHVQYSMKTSRPETGSDIDFRVALIVGVVSLGSLLGSRPALTERFGAALALVGACAALVAESSPNHDVVWGPVMLFMWGVYAGAWTAQIPRRLALGSSRQAIALVSASPALGAVAGSSAFYVSSALTVSRLVALACVVVAVATARSATKFRSTDPAESGFPDLVLDDVDEEEAPAQPGVVSRVSYGSLTAPPPANGAGAENGGGGRAGGGAGHGSRLQHAASSHGGAGGGGVASRLSGAHSSSAVDRKYTASSSERAATWASVSCVAMVRWARTLVTIAVVGNPVAASFPLCVYFAVALVSIPVGALVPAWICSLLGGMVCFVQGVSLMSFMWVEASVRADLGTLPPSSAKFSDAVLAASDAVAALTAFVVLATPNVDSYTTALAQLATLLLACVSFGRLVASLL